MTTKRISTVDRQTSNGTTRAGEAPLLRNLTEVYVDGTLVQTILWNTALLRRLERKGMTRDDYIAQVAEMAK